MDLFFRWIFLFSIPFLLFWIIGFAFEESLEIKLPMTLECSPGAIYGLLLIGLFLLTGAIYYWTSKKFPNWLRIQNKTVKSLLACFLKKFVLTYLVLVALTLVTTGIMLGFSGENGTAAALLSVWAPIWVAFPLSSILAHRQMNRL